MSTSWNQPRIHGMKPLLLGDSCAFNPRVSQIPMIETELSNTYFVKTWLAFFGLAVMTCMDEKKPKSEVLAKFLPIIKSSSKEVKTAIYLYIGKLEKWKHFPIIKNTSSQTNCSKQITTSTCSYRLFVSYQCSFNLSCLSESWKLKKTRLTTRYCSKTCVSTPPPNKNREGILSNGGSVGLTHQNFLPGLPVLPMYTSPCGTWVVLGIPVDSGFNATHDDTSWSEFFQKPPWNHWKTRLARLFVASPWSVILVIVFMMVINGYQRIFVKP